MTIGIKNQTQLITYPDSLGGNLDALCRLLAGPLEGLFGGVHILPFFPSSGDRGFAPMTYRQVEPAFGGWDDVRRIAGQVEVVADLMVNHVSRHSPHFQDFLQHGRCSEYADMFLTVDKVWPDGEPSPEDLACIHLRKPDNPFSEVRIEDTGQIERVWTTFAWRGHWEQVDLDVHSPVAKAFLRDIIGFLAGQGVKILRLDAVGYVIKKPGTSCFFVEPDIYHFLDWIEGVATEAGVVLLPEVHAHYRTQFRLAEHGSWVYDFVLPGLVLHALYTGSSLKLRRHLQACPRRQFTTLDCHDGVPIQPDLNDVLDVGEAQALVERVMARGANVTPLLYASETHDDFDAHQVNCTYYSALGEDDDAYLAARAIQLFAPGIPQVYYVGLLAGENDYAAVEATGEGRAINRHDYSLAEVEAALQRPVVGRLLHLIRFRNEYPAFQGEFRVEPGAADALALAWRHGDAACTLRVDLASATAELAYRDGEGREIRQSV
ncbi:MAG: sucrose phosphorylase [Anaerolineae bacterium]